MANRKKRTATFCPVCGLFGAAKLGGYCRRHVPQDGPLQKNKHILQSFVHDVAIGREFTPEGDTPGIVKPKFGIMK